MVGVSNSFCIVIIAFASSKIVPFAFKDCQFCKQSFRCVCCLIFSVRSSFVFWEGLTNSPSITLFKTYWMIAEKLANFVRSLISGNWSASLSMSNWFMPMCARYFEPNLNAPCCQHCLWCCGNHQCMLKYSTSKHSQCNMVWSFLSTQGGGVCQHQGWKTSHNHNECKQPLVCHD